MRHDDVDKDLVRISGEVEQAGGGQSEDDMGAAQPLRIEGRRLAGLQQQFRLDHRRRRVGREGAGRAAKAQPAAAGCVGGHELTANLQAVMSERELVNLVEYLASLRKEEALE